MKIIWEDSKHSLGIAYIDNQHKELFSIVNSIDEIKDNFKNQNTLLRLIKRLYAYTHYHFLSEESLFEQVNYYGQNEHKEIHKDFALTIKTYFNKIKSGEKIDCSEILDILINWIKNHIEIEDKKYLQYLNDNDIDLNINHATPIGNNFSEMNLEYEVKTLWEKRKLAINIVEIDNQHRELVYILQQVNDLNKTGISDTRVKIQLAILIKKLYYYSQFHFELEESLMIKDNYPGFKTHKDQHQEFMKTISDFAKKFQTGKTVLTDEIILFLKDWTLTHILQDDAAFKLYLDSLT